MHVGAAALCSILLLLSCAPARQSTRQALPHHSQQNSGARDDAPTRPISLSNAIEPGNLDADAFTEWVEGRESAVLVRDGTSRLAPSALLSTTKSRPGVAAIAFGKSKTPGVRHLRVGFKEPVLVGTILLRGGVLPSVLKADAPYPGDVVDHKQWINARRLEGGRAVSTEAARDAFVLWTLPSQVSTRALRFTHIAQGSDQDYAGWIAGAHVLSDLLVNVAPEAMALASASSKDPGRVIEPQAHHVWEHWANIDLKKGDRTERISPASAEWLMLVWPAPVKVGGLGFCYAGFADAEVQRYTGPNGVHPREAPETAWTTVKSVTGLKDEFPVLLPVDWVDFGREIITRALRIRITKSSPPSNHGTTKDYARDGKRVWLGHVLAVRAAGTKVLPKVASAVRQMPRAPIPIPLNLPESGWVTLVIDDRHGKRVRNLISDTFFQRGKHTLYWDGSDDLGRDPSAAAHGVYDIPTRLVAPGLYRVRGLWRKQIDLKYEFPVYNPGDPPWETHDQVGGWLANHTPPSAALFVPDAPDSKQRRPSVLLGSYVSEGTAGLIWVGLDGKKWRGQHWVGGTWTGAPYLARDQGKRALPGVYAYAAAAWSTGNPKTDLDKGEIRVTALTDKADRPIVKYEFKATPTGGSAGHWEAQIGGLAVRDGVVLVSLPTHDRVLAFDARSGKLLQQGKVDRPRGLAFDQQGRLLALSDTSLVRFASMGRRYFTGRKVLVSGLDEPHGLTIDESGRLYVTERGNSHHVEVYSAAGELLRTIGKTGRPAQGRYDPLQMHNPRGVTVDSSGKLWVAEEDYQPKRVSVWSQDGALANAFYGPSEYGGGGSLDPNDKTKFYYHGMQFALDWKTGRDRLESVFYRPDRQPLKLAFRSGLPQTAFYVRGRRYFTNAYNNHPTGGSGTAFIFADRGGVARPIAGAGRANEWDILKTAPFTQLWPMGTDPKAHAFADTTAFFLWSDHNADGAVQVDEVAFRKGRSAGVTVSPDLSFTITYLNDKSVRFAPKVVSSEGIPKYDLAAEQLLVRAAQDARTASGDQVLTFEGGWSVHSTPPLPFSRAGIAGTRNGVPMWSYPVLWPGLPASHSSPVPDRRGMVIGHTRLLGPAIEPRKGEPLFMVNGNHGPVYVFTRDGLFVAELFHDMRVGRPWAMPRAARGMSVRDVTPGGENFWPSVTQTGDGRIYMATGRTNSLVEVQGLDTIRRIAASELAVTPAHLQQARSFHVREELIRQAKDGRDVLEVPLASRAPLVDGRLDEWSEAKWVSIDRRGVAGYVGDRYKPYDVSAAVLVADGKLYASWRTGEKDLLQNTGHVPNALFKSGGALDLMIGTNQHALPGRRSASAGDLRLLVTRVNGAKRALLYRAVVAHARTPVVFSSPGNAVRFDRVDDVSAYVELASNGGDYEMSIPLSNLGLKAAPGTSIKGDIGILRGAGSSTIRRVYWSNKATAVVADVPTEAQLVPALWGTWRFVAPKAGSDTN